MGKGTHLIDLFRKAEKIEQPEQPVTRVQFQTKFCPPCAMQQAVWDSIVDGNFIDAKIFAFSRRSRKPGQVNTPKPLFINTHVLAAACGYFRSSMLPPFLCRPPADHSQCSIFPIAS